MSSNQYAKYSGSGGGGGGSSPTIGGPVVGGVDTAVLFVHPSGILAQDATNFHFDDTTHALTITGNFAAGNFSGSSSGTNTGDVTLGTANGLSIVGQVLSLGLSSASTTGALSSTDWNTFNNKQPSGSYANTALSNLASTAVNVSILPSAPGVISLGSSAFNWETLYVSKIDDAGGALAIQVDGRELVNTAGTVLVDFSGTSVSLTNHSIISLLDPSGAQDAATKNYVDVNFANVTLAAVGSSPNANAASLSGQVLTLQPFDSTHPGVVTASGGGTTNFLRADGSWSPAGTGTVTAVSIASANGFAGSSSGGATPALTLSTSITGLLKGNGTAISAATSGTDYSAGTSGLTTGILKSTTTTGALTIAVAGDFPTLNQNTTGTSANVTGIVAANHGGTGVANNAASTLTISGNFGTTLTVSATTALTLPTSGTLSTLAGTETFSNKTFSDAITGTEISTPSNPAAGKDKLYFKSDNNLYSLDSSGNERLVGPGMVGSDWIDETTNFTPSAGFGDISNLSVFTRRVGDTKEVVGQFTMGTTGASSAYILLPVSEQLNSAKLPSNAMGSGVGFFYGLDNPGATDIIGNNGLADIMYFDGSTTDRILISRNSQSSAIKAMNVNGAYTSGSGVTFNFCYPVAGWSANNGPGRSGFQFYASSQVTTTSSSISSGTFTTFDNSPAFTFTPAFTGSYKVYCSIPLVNSAGAQPVCRIFETSAVGTLLYESQATGAISTGSLYTLSVQSVYTLTAGTPYTFDIQTKLLGGSTSSDGTDAPFYMFAELCG